MITAELINTSLPRLHLEDTVHKALQLMHDYRISHLPVVSEENYLGLLSEEDLADADDEKMPVQLLEEHFKMVMVPDTVYFLTAINICNQYDVSVLPVVNAARELQGVLTAASLLQAVGDFAGAQHTGGVVVIEMLQTKYSISEISRIVENNDCILQHLNTHLNPSSGLLTVTIQVNKKEIASLIATFERYEYDVVLYFGNEKFENEIRENYSHLMNYLNM